MANVHAAIKQIRKDAKRNVRNQAVLSELKSLGKKFAALSKEKSQEASGLAQLLVSKFDRAVSRGIIPRGRADRKKARIALHLKKLTS